jgi:hypothetical protein
MPLWDKLKTELDRAGRAAQQALDEGRIRLDAHRARGAADRCAQRLGYAIYRARATGGDIAPEEYQRLAADLAAAEGEVERLEKLMVDAAAQRQGAPPPPPTPEPQPPV